MGQALKYESEEKQVDHEEWAMEYWDNLRTHFLEQVDRLEALKQTLGPADHA
jgi:hypothetical protein